MIPLILLWLSFLKNAIIKFYERFLKNTIGLKYNRNLNNRIITVIIYCICIGHAYISQDHGQH